MRLHPQTGAMLLRPDKILLGIGIMCLCSAALLYGFVTQPPVPQTAQVTGSVHSTATP